MAKLYVVLAGFLLTAPWLGTQWIAQHYRFAKWLGMPVLTLAGYRIYRPWEVGVWLWKYSAADGPPFDTALLVMGLWAMPWIGVALWLKRREGSPRTFGTQTWGTPRQMRQAGLRADEGPIVGQSGRRYLRYKGEAR